MGLADKYDLFIFDWDGTLAEIKMMNKINEKLNFLWLKKKERSRREALYSRHTMEKLEDVEARESNEYKSVVDFLMLMARPKLQPYAAKALELLTKRRKKLVLFTNGAYWRVAREAKGLGVMRYFDFLLSAQDIKYVKPNPMGLNIIIEKEGTARKRVLYIGDMIDDVLAARLARVDCAAVTCGFDTEKELKSERPKYIFKDLERLYRALAG